MYRLRRVNDRTTKTRILDRAYQLAGLYGLESLTIGGLADELAMSKAGVYGHFGSKRTLQLQTVGYARAKFVQDVITPSGAAPDGSAARARRFPVMPLRPALSVHQPRPRPTPPATGDPSPPRPAADPGQQGPRPRQRT